MADAPNVPDHLAYILHVMEKTELVPTKLAKSAGLSGTTLSRPLADEAHKFKLSLTTIEKIEKFSGISYAEFVSTLRSSVASPTSHRPASNVSFPPKWESLASDTYTPVLGQSVTGPNGRFVMNGQEVARVFTPPDLLGVEGAYAVRVHGTSMEPAFYANQTVWLNPHMAVRASDFVVAQILRDDKDEYDSYLKQFVSQGKMLKLRQFNPEDGEGEILEFPADKVFSVHKIVFAAFT